MSGDSPNIGILNDILSNNAWIKEEMIAEMRTYFELSESEKNNTWNAWGATEVVLRIKVLNSFIRKEEMSQVNYLSFYLKKAEKVSKLNPE